MLDFEVVSIVTWHEYELLFVFLYGELLEYGGNILSKQVSSPYKLNKKNNINFEKNVVTVHEPYKNIFVLCSMVPL